VRAERCVLFLSSRLEYQWPPYPRDVIFNALLIVGGLLTTIGCAYSEFDTGLVWFIILAIGCLLMPLAWMFGNRAAKKRDEVFCRLGDSDVWPFFTRADYEQAKKGDAILPPETL
jgi:hypothetical protein